jgi:glyoxylase-like metal-dependent hydrolase (beta-lactamase superfamily II)
MHRILISGDALWEDGMGFVWPQQGPNRYIDAANATLSTIEKLDPAIVIPGHGKPFFDTRSAITRVRSRLAAFERDPAKNARHVIKVMFVFALLDRQRMPLDELPAYLARVECYRNMAEGFLGQAPETLAEWLIADLERAGAVAVADGELHATAAA